MDLDHSNRRYENKPVVNLVHVECLGKNSVLEHPSLANCSVYLVDMTRYRVCQDVILKTAFPSLAVEEIFEQDSLLRYNSVDFSLRQAVPSTALRKFVLAAWFGE